MVAASGEKYPRIAIYASSKNSTLFYNEVVKSVLEYAADKLIVHIYPKDLLLIDNYEVVMKIVDPVDGNITKNWM